MAIVPKIITNKTVMSGLKTSSLFKSASGAAGKMGKVTAETSFKNVGAGAKFSLSGFKSSSPSLGGPFYVNKKIVR
eukprot:CAMPEP_0197238606 /NCGR_PEP_ID=MMETSP1429-20130617/5117_1 /TAXON_ID=49237 /ORGANISM="Chaetoceros  sp., Strain UNC1202" /LENGTH=75 /DNA_ID=CAMNT_0042697807 /DNA_START=82 /DNA_END=309 /DNA_ORIENTATION=+